MKKILKSSVIITLVAFVACGEKDFSDFSPKSKIIVEGYLRNNQPITVRLSMSVSPNETPKYKLITNAQIALYENNVFIDTLKMVDSGIYIINYCPKNKCEYRIEIAYNDYPKIIAETYIPDSVKALIYKTKTTHKGRQAVQIYCKILNNGNDRYYGMGFYEKIFTKQFCSDSFFSDTIYADLHIEEIPSGIAFTSITGKFDSRTPFELVKVGSSESKRMIFFNNKTITNNQITIIMQPFNINTIRIYDLSPETYECFQSLAIYRTQSSSSFYSIFFTPNAIKSNIQNGLGVFGYILTYEFEIDSASVSCF
ncbi:MAG: DUF4249 domain-containing protein [Bacteroidales bacterium]|nr:DUF4249 domain-containing protein [Bacteroidales bacterium]